MISPFNRASVLEGSLKVPPDSFDGAATVIAEERFEVGVGATALSA